MATIVKRKADNVVTHFAQSANFDAGYLTFVKIGGGEVIAPSTTSATHEILDEVTLPTKYYGNMLTYTRHNIFDDGIWTILTDELARVNANLKAIRDHRGTAYPEDIEVEL